MSNDTHRGDGPRSGSARIDLLDVARGVALLAMAIYHFAWDLEFFGYVERGMTGHGGWRLFARAIASSFLFLVGIGLVLAHGRGIRWRPFWKRFLEVTAGAAAITASTYLATPEGFVFFGILHQIALGSLLGLAFLRLPWLLTLLAGAATIALPQFFETAWSEPKFLAWIGMAAKAPVSNDYVPLFPWFGAVLLGITGGRIAVDRNWPAMLATFNVRLRRFRPLVWLGRHSLIFYLLHQPLLIGLVWCVAQVAPPDPGLILAADCRRGCLAQRDAAFCSRYCDCARTEIEKADLLRAMLDGLTTIEEDARIRAIVLECSFPDAGEIDPAQ